MSGVYQAGDGLLYFLHVCPLCRRHPRASTGSGVYLELTPSLALESHQERRCKFLADTEGRLLCFLMPVSSTLETEGPWGATLSAQPQITTSSPFLPEQSHHPDTRRDWGNRCSKRPSLLVGVSEGRLLYSPTIHSVMTRHCSSGSNPRNIFPQANRSRVYED